MDRLQDFSNGPVPEKEGPRFNWLYLTNVENAVTICVPVLLFGASLGSSMSAPSLLSALVLAGLLLSVLSGWTSFIGAKTRLSTALLARRAFGSEGVKLVWILLSVSLFGWFGVQTEIFAKTFLMMAKETIPGLALNAPFVTVFSGLLMASTAVLGIKAVGKLAQIAVPFLLLVVLYSLYSVFSLEAFHGWLSRAPEEGASLGAMAAAIIGVYSVGVIVMPDMKRFAVNATHAVSSGILGIGFFYPLLLLCAALTTSLSGQADYLQILSNLKLGALPLLILLLATWTTNDLNLYSASLSLAPLFPKASRAWLTALAGILGTGCAIWGVFEKMIPLFSLLGIFTMPLLALYSFSFLSGGKKEKKIVWSSFVIWAISSFVGVASVPCDQLGLGLFSSVTTVSSMDALILACLMGGAWSLIKKKLRVADQNAR